MDSKKKKLINVMFIALFIVMLLVVFWKSMDVYDIVEENDSENVMDEVRIQENPPVFKAVEEGDIDTLQKLLAEGQDINVKSNRTISSLLHIAISYEQTEIALYLIEEGIDVDEIDLTGNTPIMLATYHGNKAVFDKLKNEVNLEQTDTVGNTLLHLAAASGNVDIFNELLNTGIDINATNENGNIALVYSNGKAMYKNIMEKMEIKTITEEIATSILFNAVDDEVVEEVVANNYVDINKVDSYGSNALIYAYTNDCVEVFAKLIELGIDVNNQDNAGNTPLYYCVNDNMVDYVKKLIGANADKRIKNNEGITPVDVAKERNDEEVLKLLGE